MNHRDTSIDRIVAEFKTGYRAGWHGFWAPFMTLKRAVLLPASHLSSAEKLQLVTLLCSVLIVWMVLH